jgi:hypothetical protein
LASFLGFLSAKLGLLNKSVVCLVSRSFGIGGTGGIFGVLDVLRHPKLNKRQRRCYSLNKRIRVIKKKGIRHHKA